MPEQVYLRDTDVAARFGVSRNTIWRWTRERGPEWPRPVRLSPGCTRWKSADIAAFEAAMGEAA